MYNVVVQSLATVFYVRPLMSASRPKVGSNIVLLIFPKILRKVTVKLTYESRPPSRPPSRTTLSRPSSPIKSHASSTFKPKAKVNSSATPASARKPLHASPAAASANTTPRPASPTKHPPRLRDGTLSPTFQPRTTAKSYLRPATPKSTPTPPELRHRSGSSDVGRFIPDKRIRNGSVSLHHAMSFSSLQGSNSSSVGSYSPPLTPTEPAAYSDHERSHSPSIRIKSKVTGMAKGIGNSLSPPSAFPSLPTTRVPKLRARTPSVSSNPSSPPTQPPVFYPITTATPAANPHRFATPRPSPHKPVHLPQHFHLPHDDVRVDYGRRNGLPKVDPANIPLPANSPPASAVSFSSHSSVSRSSASHTTDSPDGYTDHTQNIELLRSTLDTLIHYSEMELKQDDVSGQDRETESQVISSERTVEAEAKSIRKVPRAFVVPWGGIHLTLVQIADLEITNRSLLAINASLETAKHRQAKEIRELRRKLRESRLILPPRTYQAVKSSTDHDDTTDEDDDADDKEEEEDRPNDGDQMYKRIKAMLEALLDSGRKALEADFSKGAKGMAKVLNAEEVRTWRDSGGTPDHETQIEQEDSNTIHQGVSSSHVVFSDGENLESEEEVEAMMLPSDLSPQSPPILITESP
jgi:hypothetical protein